MIYALFQHNYSISVLLSVNWVKRKCGHKSRCNNVIGKEYKKYLYKFIPENGGWDNLTMIKIIINI